MRVTIIVEDNVVSVGGAPCTVACASLAAQGISVIQWYDTFGEVEYQTNLQTGTRLPNLAITDISPYQSYIDAWTTASQAAAAAASAAASAAAAAATKVMANQLPTSVQVNSTSTPALSGIYAFDPTSSLNVTAESLYIQVTTKFTNGQTTKPWPDTSGALHTFTTAQFMAFAEALALFVDSVMTASQTAAQAGQPPAWPSGPVTIP
jgi:hypothetical protein